MPQDSETRLFEPLNHTLTRRSILVGAGVTALAAGLQPVMGATRRVKDVGNGQGPTTNSQIRRYMTAGAVLGDGRVLLSGGYDRPLREGTKLIALNSAIIMDPTTGDWMAAAPMNVPRARHAAVTLKDGKVAVLGGFGLRPISSVEIYDLATNSWSSAKEMSMPRFDHTAVINGSNIYLLGGSSHSMVAGVEVYQVEVSSSTY